MILSLNRMAYARDSKTSFVPDTKKGARGNGLYTSPIRLPSATDEIVQRYFVFKSRSSPTTWLVRTCLPSADRYTTPEAPERFDNCDSLAVSSLVRRSAVVVSTRSVSTCPVSMLIRALPPFVLPAVAAAERPAAVGALGGATPVSLFPSTNQDKTTLAFSVLAANCNETPGPSSMADQSRPGVGART